MKSILYVHGFSSSGSSKTTLILKSLLPEVKIISPDLPLVPQEALQMLNQLCKKESPDLILGTSMGGMFAQKLFTYKKILINPAFHVSEFMRQNIGMHAFMNPRQNGEKTFDVTPGLCDEYAQLEANQFYHVDSLEVELTYGFFGEKDSVVDCKDEFLSYYKNFRTFPGEHRLGLKDIKYDLIPFIKDIT